MTTPGETNPRRHRASHGFLDGSGKWQEEDESKKVGLTKIQNNDDLADQTYFTLT